MTALWDKQTLVAAVNGFVVGCIPENFSGVSIDSRTLEAGDIFSVLRGIILMAMILLSKLMNEVQVFLSLRKIVWLKWKKYPLH